MSRREWLLARQKGLGGSDIAGILGLSPWATPFSVWADKVMPLEEDRDDKVKRRGRLLERAVGTWLADELEMSLTPAELIRHPVHEWALGTPDFWLAGEEGAECKTSRARWDEMPPHVRLQCLWYLLVSGAPRWHVGAYFTLPDDWQRWTIERDDVLDILDALLNRIGEWRERYIVTGDPPPLDASQAASAWLRRRHSDHSDRLSRAEASDVLLVDAWRNAKTIQQQAGEMRAAYETQLKARIGDDAGLIGDFGRLKWSRYKQTRLDMKRIRAEFPHVIEGFEASGYTTTNDAGRLTLTPKKGKK